MDNRIMESQHVALAGGQPPAPKPPSRPSCLPGTISWWAVLTPLTLLTLALHSDQLGRGVNGPEQPHLWPPPTPLPTGTEVHISSALGPLPLPELQCSSVGLQLSHSLAMDLLIPPWRLTSQPGLRSVSSAQTYPMIWTPGWTWLLPRVCSAHLDQVWWDGALAGEAPASHVIVVGFQLLLTKGAKPPLHPTPGQCVAPQCLGARRSTSTSL